MILGYTRVSTQEQGRPGKVSLPDQERIIKGFAMANGASQYDVQIFSDPGVSGSVPLGERPGGRELLAMAKPGDTVVAAKLDRMFRSASDALEVAESFKRLKIELVFWDMGPESITRSAVAKCFFTMASAFAELERERIRERIRDGKAGKRARGGYLGGAAPYGWRVVGEGRDARLELNDEEVRIWRFVKVLCRRRHTEIGKERGWTLSTVCNVLRARGIRNRNGKPFEIVQIQRLMARQLPQGFRLSRSPELNFNRSSGSSAGSVPTAM